jgi:hypothetical protein
MQHDTAGDPVTGLRWTRKTTAKIAHALGKLGLTISAGTVGRLLKAMGYSLRVNHKKLSSGSPETRDQQFHYITELRESFARQGDPVVSVDSKKRELVGNFKNAGVAWNRESVLVNDHDFRSIAKGIAIPYGIYDVEAKRGSIFVGTSFDTPAFAVACLEKWWRYDAHHRYPSRKRCLVLADNGGSNSPRNRAWKLGLQEKLSDRHNIAVTVAHYPPGASKWNPIDHRLFSHISRNWSGRPLDSYETILNYIRTTTTETGLRVKAYLDSAIYEKSVKISTNDMKRINIRNHPTFPNWNYTIRPRNGK